MMRFSDLRAKISISSSSFASIIASNQIYVDKTGYIYDLCVDNNFKFLSRPRRFGKSTIVATLEELFSHGVKPYDGHDSYFKGLDIENLWKDPKTYKVIHLDFSLLNQNNLKDQKLFDEEFNQLLAKKATLVGFSYDFSLKASENLKNILQIASINEIVILIDEYDFPLSSSIDNKEMFDYIANELKAIYGAIKSFAGKLRFVFVTGITRYKDAAFFTLGNTIKDISQEPEFAQIVGLTRDEIKKYYKEHLLYSISENYGIPKSKIKASIREEFLDKLEEYYDGYSFDYDCSQKVFSTWSILEFFSNPKAKFSNYWYSSAGTPTILVKNINDIKYDAINLLEKKEIFVNEDDFDNPTSFEDMKAPVLLYQTGYLTFAEPKNEDGYFLKFPNREVRSSIQKLIYRQVFKDHEKSFEIKNSKLDVLLAPSDIVDYFNKILNLVDYEYYPITSEAAVVNCIYIFLKGEDKLNVIINNHSAKGRCDLQIDSKTRRLALEFKFANKESDEDSLLEQAKQQIIEKRYRQSADAKGEIMSIALVFSKEKRQITKFAQI